MQEGKRNIKKAINGFYELRYHKKTKGELINKPGKPELTGAKYW
jgi:hypothetical protein